jgi:hypothetical protein
MTGIEDQDEQAPDRYGRRASLVKAGGLAIAVLGANALPATAGASDAVSCVLAPELTEGPFYLPNERVRRDITEGMPGTSLTAGRRFLRGIQPTHAAGLARFHTVYPGWYSGRAVHIHVKVHVGGSVVHTSQLFFDDALTDRVYTRKPYSTRPARRPQRGRLDLPERREAVDARSPGEGQRLHRLDHDGRAPLTIIRPVVSPARPPA